MELMSCRYSYSPKRDVDLIILLSIICYLQMMAPCYIVQLQIIYLLNMVNLQCNVPLS